MLKTVKNTLMAGIVLGSVMQSASVVYAQQNNIAPIVTDSRIKTFVFNENEVYRLVLHYGYQSHIELDKKEEVEAISLGDPYAWKVTPINNRIFLRPLEESAHTNLTIVTDKRVYQFDLQSKEPGEVVEEGLVYTAKFFYPQGNFDMPHLAQQQPAAAPSPMMSSGVLSSVQQSPVMQSPMRNMPAKPVLSMQQPSMMNANPAPAYIPASVPQNAQPQGEVYQDKYNFDYTLTGPDNIAPDRIFDDGKKTFFEFPNNNASVPYISLVTNDDNEVPLNHYQQGNFIAVDAVGGQFILRLGQDMVNVYNESNNLTMGR